MFSFTLSQRLNVRGISLDSIFPEVKDRFDIMFDKKFCDTSQDPFILDGRIQVRLNERAIRFFYYSGSSSNTLIESNYREIAAISMVDTKEMEHDILYFSRQCEKKCKLLNEDRDVLNVLESVSTTLVGREDNQNKRLFHFPFIEEYDWSEKGEEQERYQRFFVLFIQCCFLYFIYDIEDRESPFTISPVYQEVCNKLRESIVYRLLCAKVKYTMYLFENETPLSEDEYTFKANKYADLLMNERLNEVIPRSFYRENGWFYNPEIELDFIVKKNTSYGEKGVHLKRQLLDNIIDFFYSKHAVISAIVMPQCKKFYIWYFRIIAVFSVVVTLCMLFFEKTKCFFDVFIILWIVVTFGATTILVWLTRENRSFSVFMPRVLVALCFGWFTAFIGDDLVKSQLDIKPLFTFFAIVVVISLLEILLWGEAKRHSPYYCSTRKTVEPQFDNSSEKGWWYKVKHLIDYYIKKSPILYYLKYLRIVYSSSQYESSRKIGPIIVHSYFWSLTMGVIMQFVLYGGLLKSSNALSEIVYKNTFDKAENYIMHLTNFEDALFSYRQDLDGIYVRAAISGVLKGSSSIAFMNAEINYGEWGKLKFYKRSSSKVKHIKQKSDKISAMMNRSNDILYGSKLYKDIIADVEQLSKNNVMFNNDLSPNTFDSIINLQLNCLDGLIDNTEKEIQEMKVFIADNNKYDTLITWSCCPKNGNVRTMADFYKKEAIDNHFMSIKVSSIIPGKESFRGIYIFPRMLILHALIVLIIAFVGQLIISEKSVTEPL